MKIKGDIAMTDEYRDLVIKEAQKIHSEQGTDVLIRDLETALYETGIRGKVLSKAVANYEMMEQETLDPEMRRLFRIAFNMGIHEGKKQARARHVRLQ